MYLPPEYVNNTAFPKAVSKDLLMQIRSIRERWQRFYPKIEYYAFKGDVVPTTQTPGLSEGVVGEPGGAAFDALYGETVPAGQITSGAWEQPHHAGSGVAASPELYYPVQQIHARLRREVKDKELKQYGFDEIRDLFVDIPTPLLDEQGITSRPGDVLVWNGARYVVLQADTSGWWKNTNVQLFVGLNVEHARAGS